MGFKERVTHKQFAREVFFGGLAFCCLFAIFLFVAISTMTGRSLSPLAYLFSKESEEPTPRTVQVFKTEADRRRAMSEQQAGSDLSKLLTKGNKKNSNNASNKTKQAQPKSSKNARQKAGFHAPASNAPFKKIDPNPNRSFPVAGDNNSSDRDRPNRFPVNRANFQSPDPPRSNFTAGNQTSGEKPLRSNNIQSKTTSFVEPEFNGANSGNTPSTIRSPAPIQPSGNQFNLSDDESTQKKSSTNSVENGPSGITPSPSTPLNQVDRAKQENNLAQAPETDKASNDRFRDVRRIRANPDDSFWTLSQKYYGDGKHFRKLAAYNQKVTGSEEVGDIVHLPKLEDLLTLGTAESKGERNLLASNGTNQSFDDSPYVVKRGETLFDIAANELGQGSRYVDIMRWNADRLPAEANADTVLPVGTKLRIDSKK